MALGLRFDILGRNRASGALDDVADSAQRAGSRLQGIGKAALIGLGGATLGGIAAFAAGLKGGFEEAVSYQRITDQLKQTLKATGGVAGVSADQLKAYAGELESLSGVDEELILNSQNVLATFTGIRNEVGKGNDIFTQASLAALNMSTTLGTDVSGSAVQLGKALNDPIKGITALGKAGVSFTAQQKEQIKTLVKSGDTLGAQKIILAELNKEFGGAAAAAGKGFGGTMARLKDVVSDSFRDIATRALPTLTKLADYLAKNLPGAIARTSSFVSGTLVPAFKATWAFVKDRVIPVLRQIGTFVADEVVPRVQRFVTVFRSDVLPALTKVGTFLKDQFIARFKTLVDTLKTSVIPAVQGLIVRIKENKELFITIGKVIGGFIAVVVIVGTKITQVLLPVLGRVIQVGLAVIGKVIGIVAAFSRFVAKLIEVGTAIGSFIVGAVQKMIDFPGKVITAVGDFGGLLYRKGREWFGKLKTAIVDAVATYVTFAVSIPGRVITAIGNFGGRLYAKGKEWFGRLLTASREVVGSVVTFLAGLPAKAVSALAGLGGRLLSAARSGFEKLKTGASEKVTELVSFLVSVPGKIFDAIGDLGSLLYQKGKDLIQGLINGIKDAATSLPGAVKDAVTFDIPGVNIPGFARAGGFTPAGPSAPTLPAAPTFNTSTSGFSGNSRAESLLAEQNRLMSAQLTALLELAGTPRAAASSARTRLAGVSR